MCIRIGHRDFDKFLYKQSKDLNRDFNKDLSKDCISWKQDLTVTNGGLAGTASGVESDNFGSEVAVWRSRLGG